MSLFTVISNLNRFLSRVKRKIGRIAWDLETVGTDPWPTRGSIATAKLNGLNRFAYLHYTASKQPGCRTNKRRFFCQRAEKLAITPHQSLQIILTSSILNRITAFQEMYV